MADKSQNTLHAMIVAAKITPMFELVDKLRESCTQYVITKTDEDKQAMLLYCMLLLEKEGSKDQSIGQSINELDSIMKVHKMVNNKDQN